MELPLTSFYEMEAARSIEEALQDEIRGALENSIRFYSSAIESLSNSLIFESDEEVRGTLRYLAHKYDSRVEELKKRIFEEAEHNENGETKFKRRKLLPPSEEDINSQKQSFTPLAIDFTENYHTTMKPTMCEDVISPFSSRNTFEEDTVSDLRFIKSKGNVQWNGVAGLHVAKKILVEAILLPRRFPSLFADGRKPWTRILIYGPPGTGKTLLAKMISSETKCSFISVTASSLLSCWFGASEKSIKQLFLKAIRNKPCVLFFDEVDSFMRQRTTSEDDNIRRIKNEFLTQMESMFEMFRFLRRLVISETIKVLEEERDVFLLASTNRPWDLDGAVLRRFQKRVYVPLPDFDSRMELFRIHLGRSTAQILTKENYRLLAEKTEG
jgi:SpoVK/Ycf46/Vps4 family AAA+-type ATPase